MGVRRRARLVRVVRRLGPEPIPKRNPSGPSRTWPLRGRCPEAVGWHYHLLVESSQPMEREDLRHSSRLGRPGERRTGGQARAVRSAAGPGRAVGSAVGGGGDVSKDDGRGDRAALADRRGPPARARGNRHSPGATGWLPRDAGVRGAPARLQMRRLGSEEDALSGPARR